jgi:translation initiation factor 2 beta subunit (eIF-2beta)/eIF-5
MSKEVKRVNMNGSQDPYYRYTMPCISVKVEGTTKMIKSVLVNIEDVCRAVGRPPDYLITYLGQELSANAKIEKDTGKAYVTGAFEERKVQELIFKFITDTVTCENCKNPAQTLKSHTDSQQSHRLSKVSAIESFVVKYQGHDF